MFERKTYWGGCKVSIHLWSSLNILVYILNLVGVSVVISWKKSGISFFFGGGNPISFFCLLYIDGTRPVTAPTKVNRITLTLIRLCACFSSSCSLASLCSIDMMTNRPWEMGLLSCSQIMLAVHWEMTAINELWDTNIDWKQSWKKRGAAGKLLLGTLLYLNCLWFS